MAQVSGETDSPYGYNAEAVDTNTGLQYLRARYYNSSIGGFLTQDTDTGSLEDPLTQNLYTYTGNNPVNYVDPSGHSYHEYASYGSNSSSRSDLSPNTIKATAGIGDIVSMPGEIHIKSEPTKTVKTTAGISDYLHFPGEVQVESEV
ncbi:RHS repeat-associated core domain-containing protein, partial [Lachnotalea glycerini]